MKLITSKKQKEIDNLNFKKLLLVAKIVYEKYAPSGVDGSMKDNFEDLRIIASDVFYADNII